MARYVIKCDDYVLHDSFNDKFTVLEPKLEIATNESGSLNFKLPITHKHYDKPKKIISEIVAYKNEKIIFKGRFMNNDFDFQKNKTIDCEGAFSYFLDSVLPTYNYRGSVKGLLELYVRVHNSQVEDNKKFSVGRVTVDGEISRASSAYPKTLDEIKEKLIDKLEGNFIINYDDMSIDYLKKEDLEICKQKIKFGKNLIDLSSKDEGTEIATRIIPRGKELENKDRYGKDIEDYEGNKVIKRVDIKSVNNNIEYIENREAIRRFGTITKTIVWDDVEEPVNLKRKAEERLTKEIFSLITLEVKAVDLSLIDLSLDSLWINEVVEVESLPHGIDLKLPINRMNIDMANVGNTEIVIGEDKKKLTDYVGGRTYISTSENGNISTDVNLIKWHDSDYSVNSVRFQKYGQIVIAFIALAPTISAIESGNVNKIIAKLDDKVKSAETFEWKKTTPLFNGEITTSEENITADGSLSWHTEEVLYNKTASNFSLSGDYYQNSIYKITLTDEDEGASIDLEFSGDEGSKAYTIETDSYVQITKNYKTLNGVVSGSFHLKIEKMVSEILLNGNYITTDTSGSF